MHLIVCGHVEHLNTHLTNAFPVDWSGSGGIEGEISPFLSSICKEYTCAGNCNVRIAKAWLHNILGLTEYNILSFVLYLSAECMPRLVTTAALFVLVFAFCYLFLSLVVACEGFWNIWRARYCRTVSFSFDICFVNYSWRSSCSCSLLSWRVIQ